MPREEYLDRTTQIYFGKEEDDRITKERVGEFIRNEMGLERSDGSPHWTEGILELVECGMNNYEREVQPTDPEIIEQLEDAEERLEELERENERLKDHLDTQKSRSQVEYPAQEVHLTECRILEVLCRDEHLGHRGSPNFVDVLTIAEETGLEYETVVYNLNQISTPPVELIEERGNEEEVKALGADRFEQYCDATGMDPERVRSLNKTEGRS